MSDRPILPLKSHERHRKSKPAFQLFRIRKIIFGSLLVVLAAAFVRDQVEQLPLLTYIPSASSHFLLLSPDSKIEMPLRTVRVRQIANTWHAPRDGKRQHQGQDIFAPKGTPVYSATDGVVIHMGDAEIGGNAVSVLGHGGRVYYYAHLSAFADKLVPGDFVTPDSILGCVGNTGNAGTTPSHLHFGVYGPEGAINPPPLLSDRQALPPAPTKPHVKPT